MTGDIDRDRHRAASMAEEVLAGRLEWNVFRDEWDENEDELIGDPYGLLEHQPQRGGFLGVHGKEWQEYASSLQKALVDLERGS